MLRPKKNDQVFFSLFSSILTDTHSAAEVLDDLFLNFTDVEEKVKTLDELEHKCDKSVHTILDEVNRSFITPLDREDIIYIAKVMDNVIDNIVSTANRIRLFNILSIREDTYQITKLITTCTAELCHVGEELAKMKNTQSLHDRIVEVNRIENQGDVIYGTVMQELFLKEKDPIEIIKWKEIYEHLERILDACEDVANMIEGIVSKNA